MVDDSPALRKSLRWLLKSAGLAAETYGSAREFLDAYDPTKPGCLVLDVRLQQMSGLDLQAELTARRVPTPIIIITAYGDVPTAVRALRGGAVDYIQKPFSDQLLLDRIWQAIERDRETRRAEVIRAEVAQRVARLTPREREVMGGLVAGKTSKEIGVELHLSARTVEAHRAQVLAKMEVDSGTKLVRLVLVAGSPGGEARFDSTSNCVTSLPSITWNR
ncbi:MAG TPA: response regulator [Candidatus Binatus sp.]|nr:response regulator [Candidatus Binatus sp.]